MGHGCDVSLSFLVEHDMTYKVVLIVDRLEDHTHLI